MCKIIIFILLLLPYVIINYLHTKYPLFHPFTKKQFTINYHTIVINIKISYIIISNINKYPNKPTTLFSLSHRDIDCHYSLNPSTFSSITHTSNIIFHPLNTSTSNVYPECRTASADPPIIRNPFEIQSPFHDHPRRYLRSTSISTSRVPLEEF